MKTVLAYAGTGVAFMLVIALGCLHPANAQSNLMTPGNETATINTAQGVIKIEFFPNAAPNHVKNFESLAKSGFYNGTIFHRIIPGFVIQGGDPNTKPGGTGRDQWGAGGPPYTVNAEFNSIPHHRGIVSMARSTDPNSAGSQFFIVLNDSDFLDGQYTVFGQVVQGMDVVDKIASLPTYHTPSNQDQPINADDARVKSVTIQSSQVTPEFGPENVALPISITGFVLAIMLARNRMRRLK